jgi:hypothetical protein
MTYTRPRRRTTWQSLCRFFSVRSELETFMGDLNASKVARATRRDAGGTDQKRLFSVTPRLRQAR